MPPPAWGLREPAELIRGGTFGTRLVRTPEPPASTGRTAGAQAAEVLERVDAGVVTVAPDELDRVPIDLAELLLLEDPYAPFRHTFRMDCSRCGQVYSVTYGEIATSTLVRGREARNGGFAALSFAQLRGAHRLTGHDAREGSR